MASRPPIHLWSVEADLRPLAGGSRNAVFRTIGLAPDLVFKSTDRSEEALAWLGPVHDAAEAAGLAAPRLIASAGGRLSEQGWTAEPFIDGSPCVPAACTALQAAIERFHNVASPRPQRPGFLSSRDLIRQTAGGDIDLAVMPPALAEACRAAFAGLDAGDETIVHGDLTASNILRCPDGRFALLDWDEARRDRPAFDLAQLREPDADEARAALAWEVACCWTREPVRARALAKKL